MSLTPTQLIENTVRKQKTEVPSILGGGHRRTLSIVDAKKYESPKINQYTSDVYATLPRNFGNVSQNVKKKIELSKSLSTGRGPQRRLGLSAGLFTPPGTMDSAAKTSTGRGPTKLFTEPVPELPVPFQQRSKDTVNEIMEGIGLYFMNGYLDEELSLDKKYESQTDLIEKMGGIFANLKRGNTNPQKLKELEEVVAKAIDVGDDMLRTMAVLFKKTGEQVISLAENINTIDQDLNACLEITTNSNKNLEMINIGLTGAKDLLEEKNRNLEKRREELERDNRILEEQYVEQLEELSAKNKQIQKLEEINIGIQRQKLSCEENIQEAKKKVKKIRKNINRYLQ